MGRPKGREKVDLHLSLDATLHARVTDRLPRHPLTDRVISGELARLVELLLADWLRNQTKGPTDVNLP